MRRYIAPAFIIANALVFGTAPAFADDVKKALDAFYGTCLGNGASFAKVEAAADFFDWRPLPAEAMAMLGPQDNPEAFKGWLVVMKDGSFPIKTMAGVTKTSFNGKPVQTCTLAFGDIDGRAFEEAFKSKMKPTLLTSENDGIQEFRIYSTTVATREQWVTLVLPADGSPVFSVSAMAERF